MSEGAILKSFFQYVLIVSLVVLLGMSCTKPHAGQGQTDDTDSGIAGRATMPEPIATSTPDTGKSAPSLPAYDPCSAPTGAQSTVASGVSGTGKPPGFAHSPIPFASYRWDNGQAQLAAQWTPDGSRIVFSDAGRIYVVDADGTYLKSLSGSFVASSPSDEATEIDFSPSLSTDGSKVAFTTIRYAGGHIEDHTWEIAIQGIDGCDRTRVTTNDWNDVSPSWSPDGSRIAFVSAREGGYQGSRVHRVFTIATDGSDERPLAPEIRAQTSPPVWSPDGSRVALVGEEEEIVTLPWLDTYYSSKPPIPKEAENWRLIREAVYVANADGSFVTKLAWGSEPGTAPGTRTGNWSLQFPEEEVTHFQWAPDSERLAFVARTYGEPDRLFIANPDSGEMWQILDLSTIDEAQEFYRNHPYTYSSIQGIAWSLDGSQISLEVAGSQLRGDTVYPDSGVFALAADGSSPPLLMAERDSAEIYVSWPGILERRVPFPPEHSRTKYENWSNFSVGYGPARIVRYTEPMGLNVWPEVEGWVLTAAAWDGSAETVLVKTVNNRLVAARPMQEEAEDLAEECFSANVLPDPVENPGLVNDCQVLLKIRDILAGDEVLYWNQGLPITQWPGVVVAGSPPRVVGLVSVPGLTLNGTIPPAISELTHLRVLRLEDNQLTGNLPPELSSLTMLEVLDIGDWWAGRNNLTGNIPPQLGKLPNLKYLDLSGNGFDGSIPPELGKLSKLEELHLGDNPLEGHIPPELGRLESLLVLYLGGNGSKLTGTIPAELGNLKNLRSLTINWTELTGSIPPELGNLTHLWKLHLRGTFNKYGLTGPIPRELAKLENLRELWLERNHLVGAIPPELGDLPLSSVNLRGNQLTGCVPTKLQRVWNFYSDLPHC